MDNFPYLRVFFSKFNCVIFCFKIAATQFLLTNCMYTSILAPRDQNGRIHLSMQQHIDINVLILRLKSSEFCPSQHPWSKRNTTQKSCCCAAYRGQRVCRADLSLLRQDIHRNDSCYDAIYCKNAYVHQCTYICIWLPTTQLTP